MISMWMRRKGIGARTREADGGGEGGRREEGGEAA